MAAYNCGFPNAYQSNINQTTFGKVSDKPPAGLQQPSNTYGPNGCLQSSLSACGPKICWVCPNPNFSKNWTPQDRAKGVDQVRKNIYFGGVICDYQPRSEINDAMCNRMFLNSPARPPYDYAAATETEFYLRHGESSGCSPFWRFRYDQAPGTDMGGVGKYHRIGPAPFTQK
jgi:hypothetical protein